MLHLGILTTVDRSARLEANVGVVSGERWELSAIRHCSGRRCKIRCNVSTTQRDKAKRKSHVAKYARSDDVRIAYQISGDGPFDVVWAPGTMSHLDLDW